MSETTGLAVPSTKLAPRFWRLWWASSISALGDGVTVAALPLLAASLSSDPRLVSGIATAGTIPWLVFSLHAGALVDRFDRRKVMFMMDIVRGAVTILIAVSVFQHWVRMPLLYLTSLMIGFADVLFGNAAQAIIPSLVETDQLERANGFQQASETAGRQFLGPPVGSLLFAAAMGVPFVVDGATFLASAVLLVTIRGRFRPAAAPRPDGRTKMRHEIAEGLKWLFAHRLLRTLALCLGVMNLAANGAFAVFVLLAKQRLHVGDRGFGVLLAAAALGSVAGGLLGSRLARWLGQGRTLAATVVFEAIALVGMAYITNPVPAAVFMILEGLWGVSWNVVTVALRQQIVPERLFGRVNSAYRLFGLGMMPIGTIAGGLLAHAFGIRAPFIVFGIVTAVLVVPIGLVATDGAIAAARAEARA
jgi:MFS family permease